jgi:hypothetical protein
VTGSFIADYLILVFLSSCGVFQMAAAWNGLNGLLLLPRSVPSFALGAAACVAAGCWFFLSEPRNVPDTALGLNGNEQFGYFFAGSGLGLAFTLAVSTIVSTLRTARSGASRNQIPKGLDALREFNYLQALPGMRGEAIAFLQKTKTADFYRVRLRGKRPVGQAGSTGGED